MENILVMGANKDSIKISYNGIDYVKFKDINFINDIMEHRTEKLTICARANLNTFMGRTSIQCIIMDYDFELNESKYDF